MSNSLRLLSTGKSANKRVSRWGAALLGLLLLFGLDAQAQRGKNGAGIITAAGTIVNTYTALTADVAAGASTIAVTSSALTGGAFGTTNLAPGDFVMVIQMQGATINTAVTTSAYGAVTAYNNAGRYELAEVQSVPSATAITFQCGLTNSYTAAGKVQVVRLPRYTMLTLNANTSIVAPAWNGSTGGVVALDVQGNTVLNTGAKIDVSGLGFRGGAVTNLSTFPNVTTNFASASNVQGAEKGEGIAGSQTTYDGLTGRYGRGAAANGGGGGNTHNAAGGGGANVGTGTWTGTGNPVAGYTAAWNQEAAGFGTTTSPGGGRGGYSYSANNADATTQGPGNAAWGGDNRLNQGGLGGRPLDVTNRIFLGGGGGAGDANNAGGTAGGNGGGLLYIMAGGSIANASGASGTSLLANGSAALNNTTGNDAPGGGGGGGAIVLNTVGSIASAAVVASGGNGGNHGANPALVEAEGPGGGGGAGYIVYTSLNSGAAPTFTVTPGINGTTNSSSLTEFPPNGATAGGAGVLTTAVYSAQCVIVADVVTTLSTTQTAVLAGASITYTPTVSNNSTTAATNVAPTVQLPAGLLNVVVNDKNNVTLTNSTTSGYNTLTGLVTFPTETSLAASATLTYTITFPAPYYTITIAGKAQSTASSNDPTPANNDGTAANANVQTVVSLPSNSCVGTAYSTAGSGLFAEYYATYFTDNLGFFAANTPTPGPGLTRTDANLNYITDNGWGNLVPPATGTVDNPDTFSARYRGSLKITTAGTYTLSLNSDDASYLWLDGAALVASPTLASATISNGGQHAVVTVSATVTLAAGAHNLLVFYGENFGANRLTMSYSGPDTGNSAVVVPNAVLCPTLVNVPPVAVAVTNAPAIANTNGATTIAPLASTDQDGNATVTNYKIVTLPTAAQGVLSLGGTPVTAGQLITTAQASLLQFNPAVTFAGNATFTFQAQDNSTQPAGTLPAGGQLSNNTATYTIPVSYGIAGTVFEDLNYGGGLGRTSATANGVTAGSAVAVGTAGTPATAATVELYDNAGNFLATTQTSTTAGSLGQYQFSVAATGAYTVRVVNSTVRSTRTGSVAGLLPVQTYNGTTDRVGGEDPARSDAAANSGTQTLAALTVATTGTTIGTIPESQQQVTVAGTSGAVGQDFGYNFDLITNTNNAGQGSLRQFVANASALANEAGLTQSGFRKDGTGTTVALAAGKETSIFMIPGTTAVNGLRAGLTSGLTGGVAIISTSSVLTLTGASAANTVLDGGTQTYNLGTAAGNTATGTVTGTVTTTVGVDGLSITALNVPEVEISGVSVPTVLDVETTSVTVRGLAMHGGGTASTNQTVLVGSTASATGYLFENMVVGVTASGAQATAASNSTGTGFGLNIRGLAGVGTVQTSLLAYTGNSGIHIDNGTATVGISQFLGNQFLQNGYTNPGGDGITFGDGGGSGPALVQGNLFTNPSSSALQFEIGATAVVQTLNNTITGAGSGGLGNSALEKGGIVYLQRNNTNRGSQLDIISKNVITSSQAAGIVVGYGQQNVTMSQNQISGNAGLGIDLIATSTYIVGSGLGYGNGDGVTVNDGNNPATAPAELPNRGIDFPVIYSALVSGTNLVIKGYARPGVKIELFSAGATADPTGFGEGQTYLGTVTEGGAAGGGNLAADTDPRTGLSYSGLINGRNQGTDAAANGFIFSIPLSSLPGGVLPSGTILTSTATLNNSTSEFAGNISLTADVTTTIAGPNALAAGQVSGTFTATFSNAGNAPAATVNQTVTLPAGATLTAAQLTAIQTAYPGTAYSGGSGGTLTFPPAATLAAGASNVYQFAFTAPTTSGAASIGSGVNTTTAQSPNTAPDAATFALNVTDVADVVATIIGSATAVSAGTAGSFTVVVSNNGPSAATNTLPTVQLTPGLTNVTINNAGPTSNPSPGVYNYANGVVYNANTGLLTTPAFTLPVGAGSALTAVIGYTQPSQGNVTATAAVTTATNQAGQTTNDTQTATNSGSAGFDLATTLSGPGTSVAGTQIAYAVTTVNYGPGPVLNALQTVSLPTTAALTNVFLTNGGTYSFSGGTSSFTFPAIPSLGNGQQVNNSISFTSPAAGTSALTLTALATPNTAAAGDANSTNNQVSISTNLTAAPAAAGNTANLNVVISSNAPSSGVAPGATIVFTVVQGNNGPNAATNVVTQVYLTTGLTGVTVKDKSGNTVTSSATSGYNSATGVVILPTEASEGSGFTPISYTITATAPAMGAITATATVSAATLDPVPADNVSLTSVAVNLPAAGDVATTLNGPSTAAPGESIVYTVSAVNNGTTAATGVVQTVQLPAGLAGVVVREANNNIVTNSATTGYNAATGLVTYATFASLSAGASLTRTITLPAPDNAGSATGGSIVPVASVSSSSADNVLTNNSASVTTTITPQSDLVVSLSGPATTVVGNPVTYSVTTTNNGPSIGGQQTTVQLPTGLDLAGGGLVLPAGATYNGTTGVLTLAAVPAQGLGTAYAQTAAVTFNAPTGTVLLALTAQATPAAGTNDASSGNNAATATTAVTPATETVIDLATAVTSNAPGNTAGAGGTQTAGQPITFTVTSTNNTAGSSATNAVQQLTLVAGLTGVVIDGTSPTSTTNGIATYPGGSTYNANTGVVSFPAVTLAAGTPATHTVLVTAPGAGPLVATAALNGDQTDAVKTNNTAGTSIAITPSADLLTSTTGPATTQPGVPASYSVLTTNAGPSAALGVVPTMTLPAGATNVVLPPGASLNGSTVTFATVGSLASGKSATNTVTFTTPATSSFTVNSTSTTTTSEPTTANNPSSLTTANPTPTAAPVAFNVVNQTVFNTTNGTVNSPGANTAGANFISALSSAPSSGQSIASYTVTAIPTTAQGILYYNNGGSYAAVAVGQTLTPAQAATLKFDPADNATTTASVGDINFAYTATDNLGKVSNTALYTIPVGRDNSSVYSATPNKGNANQYQTNDVLAFVIDPNGAAYNGSGLVYNTSGANTTTTTILAPGGNNGLVNTPGSVVQSPSGSGPAASGLYPANPTNALPAGVSLNTATGLIYVSNRSLLVRNTTVMYYQINVTTTDIYGGTNLVPAQFSIGAYPLPVELTDFTAQAVKNVDAALVWHTASEKNNDHFDVERSGNGTDFVKIGQVKGQGTTTSATAYALTDAGIGTKMSGLVYYRLKQVDQDGTLTYSPVRTVTFTPVITPAISLYPNPATTSTQLDLSQLPAGSYQVSVLDATGRIVLSATHDAGLTYGLDLNTIASGSYTVLVRGQHNGQVVNLTKRLIKE